MTEPQKELLSGLAGRDPELSVEWDEIRGVASEVRGSLADLGGEDVAGSAVSFLRDYGELFGIAEPAAEDQLVSGRAGQLRVADQLRPSPEGHQVAILGPQEQGPEASVVDYHGMAGDELIMDLDEGPSPTERVVHGERSGLLHGPRSCLLRD